MPVIISNATVIDGVADKPAQASILIEAGRIAAIASGDQLSGPSNATVIDGSGKYVIPGLMNANVHLLGDIRLENLMRYWGRYEDLIAEAAQVALKSGLTTVFDTWGPRRHLMAVRDRINSGEIPGSRVFCAGNIIGFDGPFSADFIAKAPEVASTAVVNKINAIWVENTGRHLMWLTPQKVAEEIQRYIAKGIDFVKYGSNEHGGASAGAFLQFTPRVQEVIVQEAHNAGITAQAHCMSVEGLRVAIESGCDLITHCNITGPEPIPDSTLELFLEHNTGAVIFPWTAKGFQWIKEQVSDLEWTFWHSSDTNARKLIEVGASLMLANDGSILAPEVTGDPLLAKSWGAAPAEDSLIRLDTGHFAWFRAMEEKGCAPMEMLRAATRNIATAYGKGKDLGTLETGKIADLVILDKNPLEAAANYSTIHTVIKDGAVVDLDALPLNPMLTAPMEPPADEEAQFIPAVSTARFPMCPMCMWH